MKFKFGVKQIVLLIVALILIGVIIAGNIILVQQAPLLHRYFGGIGGDTENAEAQKALSSGDQMVQEITEDSIVLLKNDEVDGKPYLPLDGSKYSDDAHGINLFGWGATDNGFLLVGGGSGGCPINEENPKHTTLTEAFEAQGFHYNKQLVSEYSKVSSNDADFRGKSGSTGADVDQCMANPGEGFYTDALLNQAKESSSDAIVVLTRWGAENMDGRSGLELKNTKKYKEGNFLRLTNEETIMFGKLKEKGFNVTVLLNTTNPLELDFLETYDNIHACLYIGIPGQSGAMAIPNILRGYKTVDGETVEISPSGRLSDIYARNWKNWSPNYYNVGIKDNIAYKENIYIGYKWYETAATEGLFKYEDVVQFPFGYGLSYTSFKQTITDITLDGVPVREGETLSKTGTYTVTVHVENTGSRSGKEVVQLYYTPPYTSGGIEKASINLLAFGKTGTLEPGGETDVKLTFTAYDMASYDAYEKSGKGSGYKLDRGAYEIKLMQNSHDLYEDAEKNMVILNVNEGGIQFETDPVTGKKVENLFTGSNAYAGIPVDGNDGGVTGGVTYLSRANHFSNYDEATAGGIGAPTSQANDAYKNYVYDGYNTDEIRAEVAQYRTGDQYNWKIVAADENGTPATLEQLNGAGASLVVQRDVIEMCREDDEMWKLFLDQLTTEEICGLIGHGSFHTMAAESVGKPNNLETDGPAGFNSSVISPDNTKDWTVFPAETLSGCSWDQELMYELGKVQGKIGIASNVVGWYAPGVNLHRSPYNARNYEYYSEDGVLSGYLAAATIKGAKEEGLTCYLKHFALAESGENSCNPNKDTAWMEWVTEQALRETYCKPFEIAVKAGGANAMMSAFNCVGAIWSGYNHALLTTMLREEWGFRGSIITDWTQNYMKDYSRAVIAGNDLWLDQTEQDADINFDDPVEFYAARRAAGNILYTYMDTVYTSGLESVTPSEPPYSALFVGLWSMIDIALGLGLIACGLFFFWSPLKNRKAKKAAAAAEGDALEGEEEGQDPVPDDPVESGSHDEIEP